MTIGQIIRRVFLVEIIKGMALTLKTLFSRPVTRQYPEEKREPFAGFRGLHALPRRADGTARCVGCGLCAAICPSRCIHITTVDGPHHERVVERYDVEVLRCLYCALCVEACPFQAIVLTDHYEYAEQSKEALLMDKERLLSNWDRLMAGGKGEAYFERFWKPRDSDFRVPEDQVRGRRHNR